MWSTSENQSGAMEGEPLEAVVHTKETCEQNKNQLESLKEIMMRNQQSLKKKEEEVQEYARRLSKIKSRAKLSRRNKEGSLSSKDTVHPHKIESALKDATDDTIDDTSQAKTPKAKSSLLQRKLAENRKAFELRSKELIETKRAVEEKVEAIRQQLDETDLASAAIHTEQLPVRPFIPDVLTPIQQTQDIQEKENKIMELSHKILELEATVLDLQENLKEKDSVIDSKTKAVTLMSADLSKKGKTTLDTLENTKDEMRMMQENFVLIETSLKNKNTNLLEQLQERDNRISELERTVSSFEEELKEQKIAESVSMDFSRSTMDTLAETKDAMKSMQENFVLIESSLKLKNDNLLQQLGEYEVKLAEAKERIFHLESGVGITTAPTIEDLQFKIKRLEQNNRQLLDEKYELQKNIVEMQDQIVSKSSHDNNVVTEKNNRIADLESLVEEFKQSNELLQKESKTELHKQFTALSSKNEEYSDKISDLEKQIQELKAEKDELAAKFSDLRTAVPREDDKVIKLTKELEELNKSMIKLKAQHRSKVRNLQKQLENFRMMSDTNAELIKLGNQVALLEEEKASTGDWQERVADLESKVSSQTKEIQMHIDAIATLENQKLDLTQDFHTVKREVSALEAENAESENLRVSAEMKVVELEEQLEAAHKEQNKSKLESMYSNSEYNELLKKIDTLTLENSELYSKLSKIEEKGTSDTGSTESFEAIQVNDRNDLLKKIEDLEQKNNELTLKLRTKLEEKDSSQAGSTESFETINDTDRGELLKKIEQLTQENSDLTMKLNRTEEKGSSDTGSTESFERIPEHSENMTKIELLTQENHELVVKLTKLEEQLNQIESNLQSDNSKIDRTLEDLGDARDSQLQIEMLKRENDDLTEKIYRFKTQVEELTRKNIRLQDRVEAAPSQFSQTPTETADFSSQTDALVEERLVVEGRQAKEWQETSAEELVNMTSGETNDARSQIVALEKEKARIETTITRQLEECISGQRDELDKVSKEKEELNLKLECTVCNDFARERLELVDKLDKLNREKESVAQEKHELHKQISILLQKSSDEMIRKTEEVATQESQSATVTTLEKEMENSKLLMTEYKNQIEEMNMKLQSMETNLEVKVKQLTEYEASSLKLESLERELKEMFVTAEEWKFKYEDMQAKMQALEEGKASIEEAFRKLESDNKELLGAIKEKDTATTTLQGQLEDTIGSLETKLQDVIAREREITALKAIIESKDEELQAKYMQLQNELIAVNSLQDELNNCAIRFKEKESTLSSSLEEISRLNDITKEKEGEIQALKNNVSELNKALQQSKSLAEFNEILQCLRNAEASYIELQSKHKNVLKTNDDLSRKIEDMVKCDEYVKQELTKKEQEIADLLAAKEYIDTQISEMTNDKTEAEKRIRELQMILDNQAAYVKQIQSDLTNGYKQMEQLKIKHTEDTAMLNRRLEDVIEDLTAKGHENEALKIELEEKEKLLDKNATEEMQVALQSEVADLKQKLSETESKLQVQSEKMKKIVATFNKKKIVCQELEARVAELEEKWTTEKDEKEVKNKKIQEAENSMREKDNKIADLEERLLQTRNNTEEALATSDKLTKELTSLKEKTAVLMEQIAEMGEEIERQRAEIERVSLLETTERTAKENVAKEYEIYKQTVAKENEQKQAVLDEVKEKARELSVRMQVMETEYVEQLALIKNLQAENGLLSSKQTQINEKLENAEKESEERRALLEQLQKKIALTATVAVQVANEDAREDDARFAQQCDHPDQCQNLVQTLESRLQEREAEIENLNNELANSYGNIVLLHDESLRYNDMMMQTAQERFNQSLMDRTNMLQQEIEFLRTEKYTSERRVSELEDELYEYKRKSAQCETAKVPTTIDSQQDQEDTPQLFDASKIFGTTVTLDEHEFTRLQSILKEKESQCSEHIKEILLLRTNIGEEKLHAQKLQAQCDSQVEHWKNEFENAQADVTKAERLNLEKSTQINSLIAELEAVNQRTSTQIQQRTNVEADLRNEISLKDSEIAALRTELTTSKKIAEELTTKRDEQSRALESYKLQIEYLGAEARSVNDSELIRELEQRISAAVTERDLLQLQVNDLTRSMEELVESSTAERNLQIDGEEASREKIQAQTLIASRTQVLEDSQQSVWELKKREDIENQQENEQPLQTLNEKEKQNSEGVDSSSRNVDSKWDDGLSEKLNVDEESWGWNTDDVQLIGDQQSGGITKLISDAEVHLHTQVEDLQSKIKDLEERNVKITQENKAAQMKSGKLMKKLKEYKVQIESLQQQLKTQKQIGGFFDLDTAIEEELKAQIAKLEKIINEIKEEKRNIIVEKEALLKRLDVVMSANERYMEMKERQDMEVEVLRIQNKELSNKVQSLEWRLQESLTEDTSSTQCDNRIETPHHQIDAPIVAHDRLQTRSVESIDMTTSKYKEEMDDLRDELEALAAENEQLQHFLEEQKKTIATLESKAVTDDNREFAEKLKVLNNENAQLQNALSTIKEEYDVLRKQYELSLMDANDQVAVMRLKRDFFKMEFSEKIEMFEAEISNLRRALEEKETSKVNALTDSEGKLSAINASLVEVTELLNARVQEVADLKQALQNQYVEKQQAETTLQFEIQKLTRELDERKQELESLRQTYIDEEHKSLQRRSVEEVSAIVSEATQELVQKHAIEIEGKDKELHDLAEKLATSQLAIDEYVLELRDSATELEAQHQQISHLRRDLTERDKEIEAAKADANLMDGKLQEKQQQLIKTNEEKSKLIAEIEKCLSDMQHLQSRLDDTVDLEKRDSRIRSLEQELEILTSEQESILRQYDQEMKEHQTRMESDTRQIDVLKHDLREKTEQLHYVNTQLCEKENDLEAIRIAMIDKNSLLEITNEELNKKRAELEELRSEQSQDCKTIDGLPVFKMGNSDTELQSTIDKLKAKMEAKQQELEHLKYVLSENTYPTIIQQMQDRINCLYNEKATLEASLRTTAQTLTEKQEQVNLLTQRGRNQEQISKEEVSLPPRDRRTDQEEIARLQNEMHAKEQEINELKYIIAEKDSCLQASMEPQSDEFELRETAQRLTGELYSKEQEVQTLKSTIAELQAEIPHLRERLNLEKEIIRNEAEEFLNKELQRKKAEVDEIKQRLTVENEMLLTELHSKSSDIEALNVQLAQLRDDWSKQLRRKENELLNITGDLTDKERRLAELSITKDAELHNLNVQIEEKEARIEELVMLSAEEKKQLNELRQTLTAREAEVTTMKELLEQKISEYELIQDALKKDVSVIEATMNSETTDNKEATSNELDLALYMLHQRDVRCEELTHELMQLLEERDTLQLRLSNAIRVNEELRRVSSAEVKDLPAIVEPVVEQPSPSRSEGPIEIAREAAPIEDKEALAVKLSQLHSVSHTKDVRLKDERELRHTQQMSLLAHKDVLSTLPPEAAARLVNANYTLSRDVQSQSSVLLNWLWGKSTPKVVHM